MSFEKETEEVKEQLRKTGYSEQVIENWLHPRNLKEMDKK